LGRLCMCGCGGRGEVREGVGVAHMEGGLTWILGLLCVIPRKAFEPSGPHFL
jgi:hypothetical protein